MTNTCLLAALFLLMAVSLGSARDYQLLDQINQLEQVEKCQEYYRPEPLVVQGTAYQAISPELISIDFGVETKDMQAGVSLQNNANIVSKVTESLKQLNVLETEIKTTGLSINPQYRQAYDKSKESYYQIFEGYRVYNQIKVRSK